MIFETIISTVNSQGEAHVTPFGIQVQDGLVVISPYKPSVTLDNILATQHAVMNLTDDVRVFAGALTRRQAWSLIAAEKIAGYRLAETLAHKELKLVKINEDALRPQLFLEVIHEVQHQSFLGFNRAQAAVIELAVLASRLNMLAKDKVLAEMQYLQIAVDKTAGERELLAWTWLTEKVENFYAQQAGENFA
ncbi:DUF447 domain-containing protein [Methylotenera sp.]|uniref:DUF447 domain-containing protein n=1 Tax=Methylotenera sp. TaxID=2051956 RepID=UPI0024887B98|nr:DUF447 domain-containing protein [Methylotenera sp.]MDI1299484.1 DUF447 family protein [Methylotenera sp.]